MSKANVTLTLARPTQCVGTALAQSNVFTLARLFQPRQSIHCRLEVSFGVDPVEVIKVRCKAQPRDRVVGKLVDVLGSVVDTTASLCFRVKLSSAWLKARLTSKPHFDATKTRSRACFSRMTEPINSSLWPMPYTDAVSQKVQPMSIAWARVMRD